MNVEKLKDLTTEQITELWKGNLQNIFEKFYGFFKSSELLRYFISFKKHIKHREIPFSLLLTKTIGVISV